MHYYRVLAFLNFSKMPYGRYVPTYIYKQRLFSYVMNPKVSLWLNLLSKNLHDVGKISSSVLEKNIVFKQGDRLKDRFS